MTTFRLLCLAGVLVSMAEGFSTSPRNVNAQAVALTGNTWTPEAWQGVLSDLPFETTTPRSLRVTGNVPSDLVGVLYKAGPAKFQRNGQPYKHWLEGDGAVIRLEFDESQGVTFTSRFVQTEAFQNDEEAGCTTVRGTFGTPKSAKRGMNAFDLRLKNPANTNAIRMGEDYVLALSEVGLPYRLNSTSLETVGLETFDGVYRYGNSAATVGIQTLDRLLGFGNAVVAHVRRVPLGEATTNYNPNLVMAGVQQHALTDDTNVDLWELDPGTGKVLQRQEGIVLRDTGFPPHDFICTLRHALWLTCPANGNLAPFILGEKGPAECLSFRPGATSTLHVVNRRQQQRQRTGAVTKNSESPTVVQRFSLPGPVHPVHFGCAWDRPGDEGVVLFLSGWETESMLKTMDRQEPLLGSWSNIQEGDFSGIQLQPLLKVTLHKKKNDQEEEDEVTVETVAQDIIKHIDFVKCHPNWEGCECQLLYGVVSTPPSAETPSDIGPPQTICIVDLVKAEVVECWFAGMNNILDDIILVPKENDKDERDAWIVAPCYKGESRTTSFVVLDANDFSKGPVCEAHLDDHHIPWALHGSWWPTTNRA